MTSPLCDACGLPPKPNQRLLNCTRCNSAKYHDALCQKKDYPNHKKMCRQKAAETRTATAAAVKKDPLVECQNITRRGRGIIAASALSVGCRPLSRIKEECNNNVEARKDGLCAPIVPPTLIESMRKIRCTYCFQLIGSRNPTPTNLLHLHCSMECRNLDSFWKNEQIASMKLISSGSISSMPSPTVLFCCRILTSSVTNPEVLTNYNQLCFEKVDGSDLKTEQLGIHLNILTQCHRLLLAMGNTAAAKLANDLIEPNPILAFQFMSRLTMNGFTISNAEQKALGVGVYQPASMINHSCRPNAVQSFWLSGSSDCHHPPMLQITMCRDVKIGEEVTISYCDVTASRYDRQKVLKTNYNFVCDCVVCQDTERDDDLIGLICHAPGSCNGRVRSLSSDLLSVSALDKNKQYQCDICGQSNFEDSLKVISKLMTRIETIEVKLKDDSVHDSIKYSQSTGQDLKQVFDLITKYCNPLTSWYVAWSSDVFVHWCANALNHSRNEEDQLNTCHQALTVLKKSRDATKFCYDYEGNLLWLIKRGMEAKLRLFVNPVDFEALSLMRSVRRNLNHYYPSTDEIVSSLDESIRAYSYS